MGCEHTQAECSSDLGCFGADTCDSDTKRLLLWLETECSQRDAMRFIAGQARTLAAHAQAAQPDDPSRLSTLRVLQAACCHLRPLNQAMPASAKTAASDHIVEELIQLSKQMLPLLEACVRGNAVHCSAMIIAILKSCTLHHPVFSACGRCAIKVTSGTASGHQSCVCCDGCMVVMSAIRLLLSRHRMLVRAAQDLLAAGIHGILQATAVLELAQNILQHDVALGVVHATGQPQLGVVTSQQEARALLFLRLCKAMLSTEAGATATVGARAAEAALVLAAELHAPQPERDHQRCIVWRQSGQLLSTPHSGGPLERGDVPLTQEIPMRISQLVASAAADVVAPAASCIALWEGGKATGPPHVSTVEHEQLQRLEAPEHRPQIRVWGGSTCHIGAVADAESPDSCQGACASLMHPQGCSATQITHKAPLPQFLQSLTACSSPANSALVLRAVTCYLALTERTSADWGLIKHVLRCASTALDRIADAVSPSGEWDAEQGSHGTVGVASASHEAGSFLQALATWIHPHADSCPVSDNLVQMVAPFHGWLCALLAGVGACRAEEILCAPVATSAAPNSVTVVSHMLVCVAVLRALVSEQTALRMLSSQRLLSTVRAVALRHIAVIRRMLACMRAVHGTLEVCVKLLMHLLQFLRIASRFSKLGMATGQPCMRPFDDCCFNPVSEETREWCREECAGQWGVYEQVMCQILSMENLHHLHAVSVLMLEVHQALESGDGEGAGRSLVSEQFEARLSILQRLHEMHATEEAFSGGTVETAGCNVLKQQPPPFDLAQRSRCCTVPASIDSSAPHDVCKFDISDDSRLCSSVTHNQELCRQLLCRVRQSGCAGLVMLHAGSLARLSRKRKLPLAT